MNTLTLTSANRMNNSCRSRNNHFIINSLSRCDHSQASICPPWMRLAILLKMFATCLITLNLSSIRASSSLYSSAVEQFCCKVSELASEHFRHLSFNYNRSLVADSPENPAVRRSVTVNNVEKYFPYRDDFYIYRFEIFLIHFYSQPEDFSLVQSTGCT